MTTSLIVHITVQCLESRPLWIFRNAGAARGRHRNALYLPRSHVVEAPNLLFLRRLDGCDPLQAAFRTELIHREPPM